MTRQEKYPDTDTFHYFNANPKHRLTDDCVARAISLATGIDYNTTVRALATTQITTGYNSTSPEGYSRMLQDLGWVKHKQPRKKDGTKYTGKEFCRELSTGRMIANIGGGHVVAIIDRMVWDTWDSTDGCIGNYWTKEEED